MHTNVGSGVGVGLNWMLFVRRTRRTSERMKVDGLELVVETLKKPLTVRTVCFEGVDDGDDGDDVESVE